MSVAVSRGKDATLDQFFSPRLDSSRKRKLDSIESSSSSIIEQKQHPLAVPGLSIVHNFVTKDEERQLLDFLEIQYWRTDLSRRCMHFGGTYCLLPPRAASPETRARIERDILKADPIPAKLDFLVNRMVDAGLYAHDNRPEFCIVNEYVKGQGISAHVENFRFGEPVCAVTLGSGDFMRYHELVAEDDGSVRSGKAKLAQKTGRKKDIWMPSRSLLIMRGPARRRWQHEITRAKSQRGFGFRRVSLTFRVERKDVIT